MEREEVWRHVFEQRRELASILRSLTADEWAHDSLCAGWTVRDVAAHVIATPQVNSAKAYWDTVKARGAISKVGFADAKRRGAAPIEHILADYDRLTDRRHRLLGVSYRDVLCDVLVHTQDIVRPLGRSHSMPVAAAAVAADRARQLAWLFGSSKLLKEHRLVATDHDWARGKGPVIEAPMAELLMLSAGRLGRVS